MPEQHTFADRQLPRTHRSLFYLIGYLLGGGLGLLVAPQAMLKLMLSNGQYGDVFPRLGGLLLVGLGLLVAQLVRLRLYAAYPGTLLVRLVFCIGFVALYSRSGDPFFLVLLGIVGLGLALTGSSYAADRAAAKRPTQGAR